MIQIDVVTVRQAAAELGLKVRTVQRRIAAGQIQATRIGDGKTSAYVIPRAEIQRLKKDAA